MERSSYLFYQEFVYTLLQNLATTLLPSLQKKWYSGVSPPLPSMCYIVLPFEHFRKSVAVDSPSSHFSFLLPHCYCVYIFLESGGRGGLHFQNYFYFCNQDVV